MPLPELDWMVWFSKMVGTSGLNNADRTLRPQVEKDYHRPMVAPAVVYK